MQEAGVAGELGEGGEGGLGVFAREAAGAVEAVEFHEGGFVGFGIFAGGFPERGAVGGRIENVVDDLEREAEFAAEGAERVEFRTGLKSAAESAHDERGADHGGGFVEVNELKLVGGGVGFFFCEEIFHLAADEFFAACGVGEFEGQRVG